MKKLLIILIAGILLVSAVLLYSCNGNGNSGMGTGTIAVYLTDDISTYSQVTATVNKVQLVQTGGNTECDVLSSPVAANIANLSDVLQLINVAECVPGSYNRLRLEFARTVQLMSEATGTLSACFFSSYKDQGSGNQPDVLTCSAASGICALDINGAVQVLAARNNEVALDFDLKNFEVTGLGTDACAVTMKVSPLTPDGTRSRALTGTISGLDTAQRTFDLTRGSRTFGIVYSGVTPTQPGLDTLLARALTEGLRTRVTTTAGIDFSTNRIVASTVEVKIEGTVSELASNASFTLHYGSNLTKSISAGYGSADVSGAISNGSWVNVKLTGHDPAADRFIAGNVEVQAPGMMMED